MRIRLAAACVLCAGFVAHAALAGGPAGSNGLGDNNNNNSVNNGIQMLPPTFYDPNNLPSSPQEGLYNSQGVCNFQTNSVLTLGGTGTGGSSAINCSPVTIDPSGNFVTQGKINNVQIDSSTGFITTPGGLDIGPRIYGTPDGGGNFWIGVGTQDRSTGDNGVAIDIQTPGQGNYGVQALRLYAPYTQVGRSWSNIPAGTLDVENGTGNATICLNAINPSTGAVDPTKCVGALNATTTAVATTTPALPNCTAGQTLVSNGNGGWSCNQAPSAAGAPCSDYNNDPIGGKGPYVPTYVDPAILGITLPNNINPTSCSGTPMATPIHDGYFYAMISCSEGGLGYAVYQCQNGTSMLINIVYPPSPTGSQGGDNGNGY